MADLKVAASVKKIKRKRSNGSGSVSDSAMAAIYGGDCLPV